MKVVIVGGSLVGPATELMFRQAGFDDVTTYEASKTAHVQSGGVMGLRPESLGILQAAGVQTEKLVAIQARDVVSFDLNDDLTWRFRRHDMFPGDVTSWDALHNTLANLTPTIKYGWRVRAFDEAGLHFTNGETVHPDLVVFTDGRKSKGRELMDPSRVHEYQGYMVWRGLTRDDPGIEINGFHRYYDDKFGVLFSVTEPIIQSGQRYWEFSHNLAEGTFHRFAGKPPNDRAFLLPTAVMPDARRVMTTFAKVHLPPKFSKLVAETSSVMGIPINDTATPTQNHWRVGDSYGVLIGDALAAVRLQAGAGLNGGLQQASELVGSLNYRNLVGGTEGALKAHQDWTLESYLPWIELGKVRARRTHLGTYTPTRPGWTVPALAPSGNVWDSPEWMEVK